MSCFLLVTACQPAAEAPPVSAEATEGAVPALSAAGLTRTWGAPRAPGQAMEFPYAENFEGLENGEVPFGWQAVGDAEAFARVSMGELQTARSGSNVVHLSDDSPKDAAELQAHLGDRARGMVMYSLFVSGKRPADAYMTLAFGTGSEERVVDVLFTQSGTLRYRTGSGSLIDVTPYSKEQWHDVVVLWDVNEGMFRLTLDGKQLGNFPVAAEIPPRMLTFKVGANEKVGQSAYLDDVQLVFE